MKKCLLFVALMGILLPVQSFAAATAIWLSSYTATADTTQNLCKPQTLGQTAHADFHGVCIDSATAVASTFSIFASSGSALNPIAVIDATKSGCLSFDVETSSGLTYTNSSTAQVTILYQCY